MNQPIIINDASFKSTIANSDTPVLVDFWASWCRPCRLLTPILEEIAFEYDGKILIARLDVDANWSTPADFNVRNLPTLILFKAGNAVETIEGLKDKSHLLKKIDPHLV